MLAITAAPMLPPGMHLRGKPVGVLTPAVMADASVIVLDNIPAWSLGPETAGRLARWVTEGGLSVLALGGDTSFAAGGYADVRPSARQKWGRRVRAASHPALWRSGAE